MRELHTHYSIKYSILQGFTRFPNLEIEIHDCAPSSYPWTLRKTIAEPTGATQILHKPHEYEHSTHSKNPISRFGKVFLGLPKDTRMNEMQIKKLITEKRVSKYTSFEEYKKNLILSKDYYIPLSVLEVSLRNAINAHFEKFYGTGWLVNEASFLQRDQLEKIQDAKQAIAKRGEEITKDKTIAELSFGFWVNLFKSPYDKQMRINSLKQIFNNLPSKDKLAINRNEIFKSINHIRNFRNRIFHHEKIIGKVEYRDIDMELTKILSYLDKDLPDFISRLNNVH